MLNEFIEWLNNEIEYLEAVKGNNIALWARSNEAIRIRQMLLDLMEKYN